jgi:hypothetical protein
MLHLDYIPTTTDYLDERSRIRNKCANRFIRHLKRTVVVLYRVCNIIAQLAVGPTQPLVLWVPGALSTVVKCGQGVMLTTHLLLAPTLGKGGGIPPLPTSAFHGV